MPFTPGPWNIHHAYPLDAALRTTKPDDDCPAFDYWTGVIAQGERIIGEAQMQSASAGWPHVTDVEEARANTYLIVAAPLMYAALIRAEKKIASLGIEEVGRAVEESENRTTPAYQLLKDIRNALTAADGKAAV